MTAAASGPGIPRISGALDLDAVIAFDLVDRDRDDPAEDEDPDHDAPIVPKLAFKEPTIAQTPWSSPS